MAEVAPVPWTYDLGSASMWRRTDRLNTLHGRYPEIVGVDGSLENGCRPLSGLRFITNMTGSANPALSDGSKQKLANTPFQVALRVGDNKVSDGIVYRTVQTTTQDGGTANKTSRIWFKWRNPDTNVASETQISPATVGNTRNDGDQPMDVVVVGQFGYLFVAGAEVGRFYVRDDGGGVFTVVASDDTGPGVPPIMHRHGPPIASKDTDPASNLYDSSGTNGLGGAALNLFNLFKPVNLARPGRVCLFSFSFFDTVNSPPPAAKPTNPLKGPSDFGVYLTNAANIPADPIFQKFVRSHKVTGPDIFNAPSGGTQIPNETSDSMVLETGGEADHHRKYGFICQFFDTRTGRLSSPSPLIEAHPLGLMTEPWRAPLMVPQLVNGWNSSGQPTSAWFSIAGGFRVAYFGVEVVYNPNVWDKVLIYRTVADNPKGPLALDSVITLADYKTVRQIDPVTGLAFATAPGGTQPWTRAFAFLKTSESGIQQQASYDGASFVLDEDMPKGGAAMFSEGTLYVANIGKIDLDASGVGLIRWSLTAKQGPEAFSPLSRYALRFGGEEVIRFLHAGPAIYGFSRRGTYRIQKAGLYPHPEHVAAGVSITGQRAGCEVGSDAYVLTPQGLYGIGADKRVVAVRSLQDLLVNEWAGTLDRVEMGYDHEMKVVVLHNPVKEQTVLLWLETSRVTMLHDMTIDHCNDGPLANNWQIAGNTKHRAAFYQNVYPTTTSWQARAYVLDHTREKTVQFDTGPHPDDNKPMLRTLHPQGAEARQIVHTNFTVGTDLKIKAAGLDGGGATIAQRLERCKIYSVDNATLAGRKATIARVTLNTDAGTTHTLHLDAADASQLHGLLANESLFLSPVYFRVMGWLAGATPPPPPQQQQPEATLRNFFRGRNILTITPSFASVSGVPTLTVPGQVMGNGDATKFCRWSALVFEDLESTPAERSFPKSVAAQPFQALVNGPATNPAAFGLNGNGYEGTLLFPAVECFVPDMDFQLLSFLVDGKILDTLRRARAT